MRCPSCGTDNTPDSRFCGGCGAKTSTTRVAPTVKLTDDAQFPPTIPPGAYVPQSIPPMNSVAAGRTPIHIPTPAPGSLNYPVPTTHPGRNPSVPPIDQGHYPSQQGTQQHTRNPSIPPANRSLSQPPVAASRRSAPLMSSPSLSMPAAPRRSSTLIAVIVILDLGLAGAGAMLLAKGLSKPVAPTKASATSSLVDSPRPEAAASALIATPASGSAVPIAATGSAGPAAPKPQGGTAAIEAEAPTKIETKVDRTADSKPDPKPDKKHPSKLVTKPKLDAKDAGGGGGGGNAPLDPYAAPAQSVSAAVEAKASGASGVFYLCHHNAGEVHGTIHIAFQVLPDGHVAHVSAVENTTGSDPLASCLSNIIASWAFPPHTGDTAEFVRPFKYD